jgi:hypothetical protein
MRQRLVASPFSVLRAMILGLMIPSVALYLAMITLTKEVRGPSDRLETFVAAAFLITVCSIPGAIVWAVLHALRARRRAGVLAGATIGAAYGALFGRSALETNDWSAPASAMFLAITMGGGAIACAIVAAAVWWTAYPARLQPDLSEAFA